MPLKRYVRKRKLSMRRKRRNTSKTYNKFTKAPDGSLQTHQSVIQYHNAKPQVQRGINPFPREWYTRLHYAHWTGMTCPAAGVAGEIIFRLNSLYDPDFSGAGHQPYQYDQLVPMYSESIVYGCKVDLIWDNPSSDGMFMGYAITASNITGVAGKSIDAIMELPGVSVVRLNNTGSQIRKQSVYVPLHQLAGITKSAYMGEPTIYGELMGGSAVPTNMFIRPFVIDPSGNTPNVNLSIKLTYYAKLSKYKDPGQS